MLIEIRNFLYKIYFILDIVSNNFDVIILNRINKNDVNDE